MEEEKEVNEERRRDEDDKEEEGRGMRRGSLIIGGGTEEWREEEAKQPCRGVLSGLDLISTETRVGVHERVLSDFRRLGFMNADV